MRIGINLDDTIARSQERYDFYAKKYNKETFNNDIYNEKEHNYERRFNWPKGETKNFYNKYRVEIINSLQVKKNAKYIINKWYDLGYDIFIISTRTDIEGIYKITKKWLDDKGIKYTELFTEVTDKHFFALMKCIDLYIDNDETTCIRNTDSRLKSICFQAKGNYKGVVYIDNWTKIFSYLKSIQDFD